MCVLKRLRPPTGSLLSTYVPYVTYVRTVRSTCEEPRSHEARLRRSKEEGVKFWRQTRVFVSFPPGNKGEYPLCLSVERVAACRALEFLKVLSGFALARVDER